MPRCYVNINSECFFKVSELRGFVLPEMASLSSKANDVNHSTCAQGKTHEIEPANNKTSSLTAPMNFVWIRFFV